MKFMQMARFSRRALAVLLLPCSLARADVVADWNAIALTTLSTPDRDPAYVAHALATVHVAMFEVMNFIEGTYVPRFLVRPPAPVAGSGEGAAAAAAHYVLRELHPDRAAALDAALERSLASIGDPQQKANARVWGRHLGANIYAIRSADVGGLAARPAPATAAAGTSESLASIAALNASVTKLIERKGLKPIDAARVHAQTSMALSDAYAEPPAPGSLAANE
ncbi:MAG TPA: hypothetical protein VKE95_10360 [Burkholderiales bacterium]|nr:hypothetical protein [Burkholderiales bacterium]